MQYILTEEEMAAVRALQSNPLAKINNAELQAWCSDLADTVFVIPDWDDEPVKWGCILTINAGGYCDICPAKKLCPHRSKRYSK